ncbi:hypothetical protein GPAL_3164 [Glaciecola pallidula DSM 14239 = ACAM 615]|jgi:hypothetical protein|uniref:Uncharacterized protein n=1 Tax=Brumicola pallidula DSM 14239 = ACAM 615 TaxID=1121922 RepID=K7A3D5_9ALTE|nr:hypothetical protein GPAL_3164 [Glaciecola pallidula DSM 14239 = ACAM 615]
MLIHTMGSVESSFDLFEELTKKIVKKDTPMQVCLVSGSFKAVAFKQLLRCS